MKSVLALLAVVSLLGGCGTTEPKYSVGSDPTRRSKSDAEKVYADQVEARAAKSSRDDVPPRVITSRMPEYPPGWRRANIAGPVIVQFSIEADGSVSNPSVRDSPSPELAAICLHAILRWKFSPATRDGVPVRVQAQQQFEFKLE
jgi:TonB family protein